MSLDLTLAILCSIWCLVIACFVKELVTLLSVKHGIQEDDIMLEIVLHNADGSSNECGAAFYAGFTDKPRSNYNSPNVSLR